MEERVTWRKEGLLKCDACEVNCGESAQGMLCQPQHVGEQGCPNVPRPRCNIELYVPMETVGMNDTRMEPCVPSRLLGHIYISVSGI